MCYFQKEKKKKSASVEEARVNVLECLVADDQLDSDGLRYKRSDQCRRGKAALGFLGVPVRATYSLTERVKTRGGPELSQRTVVSRREEHDLHNYALVLSIVHACTHNNYYNMIGKNRIN